MIYMRGIKFDDLLAIVDFLYRGEANIYQESLESFLAIAEELQMKGLMGKTDENMENTDLDQKYLPREIPDHDTSVNVPNKLYAGQTSSAKFLEDESDRTMAVSSSFTCNLEELEERVMSMMGKSENKLPKHNQRRADLCKVWKRGQE